MLALWSATGSSNCPEARTEPAVDRHRPPRAECFRTAVWCEDVEEASASQALNNGAFSAPRRRICLPPVDRDHTSGCRKWVRCASRRACSSRMRAQFQSYARALTSPSSVVSSENTDERGSQNGGGRGSVQDRRLCLVVEHALDATDQAANPSQRA